MVKRVSITNYYQNPLSMLTKYLGWCFVRHMEGEFWIPSECLEDAPDIPAPPTTRLPPSYKTEEKVAATGEEFKGDHSLEKILSRGTCSVQEVETPLSKPSSNSKGNLFVIGIVHDLRSMGLHNSPDTLYVSLPAFGEALHSLICVALC